MLIVKRRSYPCRCRKCGQRKRLAQHPDDYKRAQPRCSCKNRTWRVDVYRASGREARKQGTCRCDEYHFPHRWGSGVCKNNAKLTIDRYRELKGF